MSLQGAWVGMRSSVMPRPRPGALLQAQRESSPLAQRLVMPLFVGVNCLDHAAMGMDFHGALSRFMAFRRVRYLRMQATAATFLGLPASTSRR